MPQSWKAPERKRFRRRATPVDVFSGTYCDRPFSEILISDQDRVRPCPWYRGELGRLSEGKTLADIFFGREFQRLRRNMLRPQGDPGCRGCPRKADLVADEVARSRGRPLVKVRRLLTRIKTLA